MSLFRELLFRGCSSLSAWSSKIHLLPTTYGACKRSFWTQPSSLCLCSVDCSVQSHALIRCDRTVQFSSSATRRSAAASNSEVIKKVVDEIEERKKQQNKLFAIVHISGRQFKITPNDLIVVNRIEADVGDTIFLEKVLLAGSEDFTLIGRPLLSEELIRITATVTEHTKTAKVIVFKKKRRKNYKRKQGHRQPVSYLRINTININTDSKLC